MALIVTAAATVGHDPGASATRSPHPERPSRLRAVLDVLGDATDIDAEADDLDAALRRVHPADHLEHVAAACRDGRLLDPDTPGSPAAWRSARLAASAALAAVEAVLGGADRVFVAARPPGHHAEPARAMGFCYLNNVAVAARAAQAAGLNKIATVDFDVHHGNGTQAAFYDDPSVFFASVHEDPARQYPGTGFAGETGTGDGLGTTLNLPLPTGTGDEVWLDAVTRAADAAAAFGPDLLLISAGFDAHAADPLGGLDVSTDAFAEATRRLLPVCPRVVSQLEGGYDLAALAAGVGAHVDAMDR